MVTFIYFILIIGVIVVVHEFGHFLFAKLFGVHVYEFSIGMGPRLWKGTRKNDETEYSIRGIPLGGYVAMAGEEDTDEDIPKEKQLIAKKPWQKIVIMVAGATFNFISAYLIILFIALIWGAPSLKPVVHDLQADMPAQEAGIMVGDTILEVNGKKVTTVDDVSLFLQIRNPEEAVVFKINRDNNEQVISVIPKKVELENETYYQVGVIFDSTLYQNIGAKLSYSVQKTGAVFKQMYITLTEIFTGGISVKQLSGPVGIYSVVDSQKSVGFKNILFLIALLSINVGVINLLPIPALDGSKIVFVLIEKITNKPVKQETENLIHVVGFVLLITLLLVVTFNDIIKLF